MSMSYQPNTVWLESKADDFDDAVRAKNWTWAAGLIDEIANAGFAREAVTLWGEMFNARKV